MYKELVTSVFKPHHTRFDRQSSLSPSDLSTTCLGSSSSREQKQEEHKYLNSFLSLKYILSCPSRTPTNRPWPARSWHVRPSTAQPRPRLWPQHQTPRHKQVKCTTSYTDLLLEVDMTRPTTRPTTTTTTTTSRGTTSKTIYRLSIVWKNHSVNLRSWAAAVWDSSWRRTLSRRSWSSCCSNWPRSCRS